jgi:ElaB/YqjD/DUF883 family membrane-anchored ribosome-binding protein
MSHQAADDEGLDGTGPGRVETVTVMTGGHMDSYESETFPATRSQAGIDRVKNTVADKLNTAAEALRRKTDGPQQNNNTTRYGKQAADWLESSADYLKGLDVNRVKKNIENSVRQNPGRTLLIAGAAGLLLGTLVRRR